MFRSISQLEAYYWVACLGSFHAAAARLNISQPSVTQSIRTLEANIGTELFIRSHRGVSLTEQGKRFFEYVDKVITGLNEMGEYFQGREQLKGTIRVGVPDGFAVSSLTSFLEIVERDYPDLAVSVCIDNSHVLTRQLEEGNLDIALITRPRAMPGYCQEFLGYSEVIWISSPSLLQSAEKIDPAWLSCQKVFTNPSPSPTYSDITGWFGSHKLIPSQVITSNNVLINVEVTMNGLGVTVVAKCIVRRQLKEGSLIELKIAPSLPKSKIYAVFPKRALNRGKREFVKVFCDAARDNHFLEEK